MLDNNTLYNKEIEEKAIQQGVLDHLRETDPTYSAAEKMVLTIKNDEGYLLGGASGFYFLGCLNIEWIWVDKAYRGQGYGQKIMKMIDEFAERSSNRFIILFCYGKDMLPFYKKHGYFIEFTREMYDHNISKYYLRKNLY